MALDQSQKDKIINALRQLDHSNEDHWSEDGMPRVSVIQKLTNDPSVRRIDVNEVAPGFVRQVPTETGVISAADEPIVKDGGDIVTDSAVIVTDGPVPDRAALQAKVDGLETEHQQNLRDAQDLQRKDQNTLKALVTARQDLASKFPRVTHSQMVQDYLRSEHQKRMDAAAGQRARQNGDMPADIGRGSGKRVGSDRPYAMGPNGKLVRPMSRLEMARQRGVPSGPGASPAGR